LDVGDDVDLVEVDEAVENTKSPFVENTGEDDLFEELKAVGLVDLVLDNGILDLDYLAVFGGFLEELTVRCLVSGDLGIV
jgi:hypothetical protein